MADKKLTPKQIKEIARKSVVVNAQKGLAEKKQWFLDADKVRANAKHLLKPSDILDGKDDSGSLIGYMTRQPNGEYRQITIQDLIQFEKQANKLRHKWKKGIRAKDIVSLSTSKPSRMEESDFDKAKKQIHAAVPIATKAGELKFSTNSGPNSDRDRHYVTVRMLNFPAAVSAASPPEKIIKDVLEGPLQIGCTCGQWRFVYAYMATVGGYGLEEHRETAFPKIKNPTLTGVACKHIVKVASVLYQSPTIKGFVTRLITVERDKTQSKLKRNAMAEMKDLEASMAKEHWHQKTIRTEEEKRAKRASQPSSVAKAQAKAEAKLKDKVIAKTSARNTGSINDKKAITSFMSMGFSEKQAQAMLAAAKANQ